MKEIFHRTSVRTFVNKPVEEEKMEQLLRAAMAAPTATNQQPWEFFVVKNKDVIAQLAQLTPYSSPCASAPVVLVVAYRKDCRLPEYGDIDCSIACENIWLEADHLGLGTVMLGVAPMPERMQKLHDVLAMDENLTAFTMMPIGYPVQETEQKDRFDAKKIHWIG